MGSELKTNTGSELKTNEAIKAVRAGKVLLYMQESHAKLHMQLFPGARFLGQDRSVEMVTDVMRRLKEMVPPQSGAKYALIAVGPMDKTAELASRLETERPDIILVLAQIDGGKYEVLAGRPYNPKEEITDVELLRQVLRLYVVVRGEVHYYSSVAEMLREIASKYKKVAVFNDTMRQSLQLYARELDIDVEFVKTCDGAADCAEINALGGKPSYRISFPPTTGKLTAEEMVQLYRQGQARAYWSALETEDITQFVL